MNEFTNKNYVTDNTYRKPERFGDRNYVEDNNDDFRYLQNRAGELAGDIFTNIPVLIFGGAVVQGTGDTLDITAGNGYVKFSVEVAGNFTTQTPPTTSNEDITMKVSWTAQDDLAVPSATLDGATTNYVKVKYKEATLYSRLKAEAAGSYAYKKEDSFEFVVDSTSPGIYELCLKTFTGTPSGSWTFADYTGHWVKIRGQQDTANKINQDLDTNADVDFNSVTTTDISTFKNFILGDSNNNILITDTGIGGGVTGNSNVCVGNECGKSLTSGVLNTCMGYQAGEVITSGSYNTCIGIQAGDALNGDSNTCIGRAAGSFITSGNNNTMIGFSAGNPGAGPVTTASDVIAIGNVGQNVSDTTYIDNIYDDTTGSSANVFIDSNGRLYRSTVSSERYKENIMPTIVDSSKLYNLQLKEFDFKDKDGNLVKKDIGYIAEEFDLIYPEFVIKETKKVIFSTKEQVYEGADADELLPDAIESIKLIYPIIEEIKNLNNRIKALEGV